MLVLQPALCPKISKTFHLYDCEKSLKRSLQLFTERQMRIWILFVTQKRIVIKGCFMANIQDHFIEGKNWRGDRAGEERSIKPWIACKLPGGPKHPQMSIAAFTSISSLIPHSFAHRLGGKELLCKMHTECHDAAHTSVSMLLPCLVLANVALGSCNNTQKREREDSSGRKPEARHAGERARRYPSFSEADNVHRFTDCIHPLQCYPADDFVVMIW